ncbi:MAG: GTP cyclohydrolase II [Caldilineaceae bacterium]
MLKTLQSGALERTVSTRLPTAEGHFQLLHYQNDQDEKEHLALVMGDVWHQHDVLVRVHSECFTGDVLGSQRCDCGEQLHAAMAMIAAEGQGVIVYLRQEGRGIGLQKKLQAYNLQDQGHDTVDANLLLGHQADERTYWAAAGILRDLGIRSLRLLTNNPDKMGQLREAGLVITARVPIEAPVHAENRAYLMTKVQRMHHLLHLPVNGTANDVVNGTANGAANGALPQPTDKPLPTAVNDLVHHLQQQAAEFYEKTGLPFVTLSYAQSIDGSMATAAGQPLAISGELSLRLTHLLRATHAVILVGIGTVLADNPRLTTRLVEGFNPQPVILDSTLRISADARCVSGQRPAWIATTSHEPGRRRAIEAAGARVLPLPSTQAGQVDLLALLKLLGAQGIRSIMVEGGPQVLSSFVRTRLANCATITIAPIFVGGLRTMPKLMHDAADPSAFPCLRTPRTFSLGDDTIVYGGLPHCSEQTVPRS